MITNRVIFNIIYEATHVSMAPCDIDEIIAVVHTDIARLVKRYPNDEDLGGKIRQYCSEGLVGESGENADDTKTDSAK